MIRSVFLLLTASVISIVLCQSASAHELIESPLKGQLIPTDHWIYSALDHLQELGRLQDYPDSFFKRGSMIHYDELVTIAISLQADFDCCPASEGEQIVFNTINAEFGDSYGYRNVKSDRLAAEAELVPAGSWVYPALDYLQQSDMLEGYPVNFFANGKLLSLYQLQQALARLDDAALQRNDLLPHQLLLVAELEREYPSGRLQMGKSICERMLERVIKDKLFADIRGYSQLLETIETSEYDDVPLDHWAYKACAHFVESGLLEGYPEGFFSDSRLLTRYEIAQSVARLMDTVGQSGADNLTVLELCTFEGLKAEFTEELKNINRVTYGH